MENPLEKSSMLKFLIIPVVIGGMLLWAFEAEAAVVDSYDRNPSGGEVGVPTYTEIEFIYDISDVNDTLYYQVTMTDDNSVSTGAAECTLTGVENPSAVTHYIAIDESDIGRSIESVDLLAYTDSGCASANPGGDIHLSDSGFNIVSGGGGGTSTSTSQTVDNPALNAFMGIFLFLYSMTFMIWFFKPKST